MAPSVYLGEFLGTMFLILLGDGVVAGVLLNKSKAQNAGWIVITAGWAFAVMVRGVCRPSYRQPGRVYQSGCHDRFDAQGRG